MYDLTWPKYVLLGLMLVSLLASAITVGKPREPISGGTFAVTILLTLSMAWLVVIA